VPRASGEATVVRARMTARERLTRIIQRRELLVGMVRNELKIKYKNSVLGFAWSLLNPLLYLVVFYVAFTIILGSNIPSFPIWLLSGLLVWNLFSTGLGAATGSVVANSGLVKKVSFPREILPLASVGSMLVHFFLQSLVLFTVLAAVRWHVAWAYVPLIPLALIALLLVTSALGILLSAVNVYLRDTSHFLELALLAWFWMTPIIYPFQMVASRDSPLVVVWYLNPMVWIVVAFQRAIYNQDHPSVVKDGVTTVTKILPPDAGAGWYGWHLLVVGAFAIAVFLAAVALFGRREGNFAEEL
jgi:ABC-2 type transport system permease protein